MKNIKHSVFYVFVVGLFSALIYWTIHNGKTLEQGRYLKTVTSTHSNLQEF